MGLFRRVIIRCVSNTYTESAYKKTFSSFSKVVWTGQEFKYLQAIERVTMPWINVATYPERLVLFDKTTNGILQVELRVNLRGKIFDSPQDTWATLTRRKEFLQVQQYQQVMEQKSLESSMGNEPRPRLERPYRSRSKSRLRSSHYEVEHLSG